MVVETATPVDVVNTFRLAREHGFELAVMATGHGTAAGCDGGILLRSGRLDAAEVELDGRTALIKPSVSSGWYLAATEPNGLVIPAGTDNVTVYLRNATTTASSSTDSTVYSGAAGPVLRSAVEVRFFHLATIFGVDPVALVERPQALLTLL